MDKKKLLSLREKYKEYLKERLEVDGRVNVGFLIEETFNSLFDELVTIMEE